MHHDAPPILVIGMSRSGTTLLTNFLSLAPSVRAILEPHLLWKAGSFGALDDATVADDPRVAAHVRGTLEAFAEGRRILEKSPPNMLRPDFVHAVFPDARVLLIERDAVACIRSNLNRTESQRALSVRRLANRYLGVGRRVGGPLSIPMKRPRVGEQVRPSDAPAFALYAARLAVLRSRGLAPFGPKLPGFADTVREEGLVDYYVRLTAAWRRNKARFLELYGSRALPLALEDFSTDMPAHLERIAAFCGIPSEQIALDRARETLSVDRIRPRRPDALDDRIRARLEARATEA